MWSGLETCGVRGVGWVGDAGWIEDVGVGVGRGCRVGRGYRIGCMGCVGEWNG